MTLANTTAVSCLISQAASATAEATIAKLRGDELAAEAKNAEAAELVEKAKLLGWRETT